MWIIELRSRMQYEFLMLSRPYMQHIINFYSFFNSTVGIFNLKYIQYGMHF